MSYSHFCDFFTAEHMLLISSMDDMGNKNVEIVLNMFQMLVSNKVGSPLRFPLKHSYLLEVENNTKQYSRILNSLNICHRKRYK